MAQITCGNCHSTHHTVDEVRACYNNVQVIETETGMAYAPRTDSSPVKPHVPATERQMSYLNTLLSEREVSDDVRGAAKPDISKELASMLINKCLQFPKKRSAFDGTPDESGAIGSAQERQPATEGMYKMNGEVYKVQRAVNGSGNLYAKRLISGSFVYAPGAINRLDQSMRMTLEQAKEWGLLYGTCCVCGRTLTDERSIALGIGPICGAKTFWSAA